MLRKLYICAFITLFGLSAHADKSSFEGVYTNSGGSVRITEVNGKNFQFAIKLTAPESCQDVDYSGSAKFTGATTGEGFDNETFSFNGDVLKAFIGDDTNIECKKEFDDVFKKSAGSAGNSGTAWQCLCYQEHYKGKVVNATACRATEEACKKFEAKTEKGSKAIVKGSLIKSCTAVNSSKPEDSLGGVGQWLPSKKPGATWTPAGCFLACDDGREGEACRTRALSEDKCEALLGTRDVNVLLKKYGKPVVRKETVIGNEDDYEVQQWTWNKAGLRVTLDSSSAITYCAAWGSFKGVTQRGIRIGSTKDEVIKAYSTVIAKDGITSKWIKAGGFWASINFKIKDGKVKLIKVGEDMDVFKKKK